MLNRSRWPRALGRSANWRYYAIVVTADGHDLNELLVSNGLARIYGTRTPLPDGRDSRTYLAHLHELENEARAAKRGAWGKVHQSESVHFVIAVWKTKEAESHRVKGREINSE